MKIIFFADTHIQNGIRKEIFVDFIDYLQDYAISNEIKTIICGGDLFDSPLLKKLNNETFIDSFFKLKELSKYSKLYFIIGNHTIHRLDNKDNIVNTLSTFSEVITDFHQIDIDGNKIDLLPYVDNWDKIPESGNVLFSHFPVRGMVYGGQKDDDEKGVPIEKFSGYKKVLLGDIHKHQEKENIVYVGSPYMISYGERRVKEHGFIVFDTDDNSYEFIKYSDAPKYIQVSINDALKVDVKNSFVKVEIKDKTENFIKLKHILYERGALEVLPEFSREDEEVVVEDNIDFDIKNKLDSMLFDYLDSMEENKEIDKDKLKNILTKVME